MFSIIYMQMEWKEMCACVVSCVCLCTSVCLITKSSYNNPTIRWFNQNCHVKLIRMVLWLLCQYLDISAIANCQHHISFSQVTRANSFARSFCCCFVLFVCFCHTAICNILSLHMIFPYWAVGQAKNSKITNNWFSTWHLFGQFHISRDETFRYTVCLGHRELFRFGIMTCRKEWAVIYFLSYLYLVNCILRYITPPLTASSPDMRYLWASYSHGLHIRSCIEPLYTDQLHCVQ